MTTYNRSTYIDQKRKALEFWVQELENYLTESNNVKFSVWAERIILLMS